MDRRMLLSDALPVVSARLSHQGPLSHQVVLGATSGRPKPELEMMRMRSMAWSSPSTSSVASETPPLGPSTASVAQLPHHSYVAHLPRHLLHLVHHRQSPIRSRTTGDKPALFQSEVLRAVQVALAVSRLPTTPQCQSLIPFNNLAHVQRQSSASAAPLIGSGFTRGIMGPRPGITSAPSSSPTPGTEAFRY